MTRPVHQFSQTKRADIPRSSFDLSHGYKTTFETSKLVPILSLEVLPGDTINCRAALFGRLSTPIKPVLDNLYLETFFFFTPYRQVWENFTKFMGEQVNPGDSIDFTIPRLSGVANVSGTVADYMGIPIGLIYDDVIVSALPLRCYNAIFNFWFRDENLIDSKSVPVDDGPDSLSIYSLMSRRKRRDYLTSALPWPQKGDEVVVPLGDTAPIIGLGIDQIQAGDVSSPNLTDSTGSTVQYPQSISVNELASSALYVKVDQTTPPLVPEIFADLKDATAISINQLRESFQIQKLLERDARGGTRYPEILKSHFQVTDPQLLVHQRPLFLGGGSTQINFSPVAQTTDTLETAAGDTPQGNLAAYATVSANNHGFTASFTEHGHVIGIVNVRADLTYQQGLERYWSRQTRYDFYFPVLSHLGEQVVKNQEIFVSNNLVTDNEAFGYMPRFDEYRFKQSQITGLFRSDATDSLDVWHLAQDFAALPSLNELFITDNVPIGRILAVPSEPAMLLDVYFKIRAARPLPLYATPGLIDHF